MHLQHSNWLSMLLLLATTSDAAPTENLKERQANSALPYAPIPGLCPSTPLLRSANGLSSAETAWFNKKKPKADAALRAWLAKFGTFSAGSMPTIASSVAGGFLRASMLGAGIHQELDGTESTGAMAGLLQAISYEATLSGSAAYQAGLMQNNWPSVASLSAGLWQPNYAYGVKPEAAHGTAAEAQALAEIIADVGSRTAAGYPATSIDLYGRLLGYSNLYPPRGGVGTLMSDARNQGKFASADVPLPIMTAIGMGSTAACNPGGNGTQYEFTPFEFGSWDHGVASFMDMKYLGTHMLNGGPAVPGVCTTGYDNLGLVVGTTANTISGHCSNVGELDRLNVPLESSLQKLLEGSTQLAINRVWYSAIPNPFFQQTSSPLVNTQAELSLVDGGNSGQVIPLWPLLHRSSVDVTFVWDNYYDAGEYLGSTGQQLYNTYTASTVANNKRMPVIPPKSVFESKGLNKRPAAFGCNNPNVQTFIYVPYVAYIPQTQLTHNLTTTPQQTRNYVSNGNLLANNNNNANWPKCVACLIMKKKATSLPSFCSSCFSTYCYN